MGPGGRGGGLGGIGGGGGEGGGRGGDGDGGGDNTETSAAATQCSLIIINSIMTTIINMYPGSKTRFQDFADAINIVHNVESDDLGLISIFQLYQSKNTRQANSVKLSL